MRTFRLLVASNRPAVYTFFSRLDLGEEGPLLTSRLAIGAPLREAEQQQVARASAAVVDVAVDPTAATGLCRELLAVRADLPIMALFCCPRSVTLRVLQGLAAAGVYSLMDLQTTPGEVVHALKRLARGGVVMHVQVGPEYGGVLAEAFSARPARRGAPAVDLVSGTDSEVLTLVAQGLSDREIAERLRFSPRTISHQVGRLRAAVGARNRAELAAWAGHNGLYVRAGEARTPQEPAERD